MKDKAADRLILLMNLERLTTTWLAERTGISRDRWKNCKSGAARMRSEETEALCHLFPEYTMWIAAGVEHPEAGQISPLSKDMQRSLNTDH